MKPTGIDGITIDISLIKFNKFPRI